MAIVTLLTDYGAADTYVGQLKGAILGVSSTAILVDLTHAVPPQDVRTGAFLLWTAVKAFPPGSIHVAIVDPGVGSPRRAIAANCARGDLFVGPDNGLLAPAIDRLGGTISVVELTNSQFWRPDVSHTFHGRDIFGPVAGHLARGVPLEDLGTPGSDLQRPFTLPPPRRTSQGIEGEVVHLDGFGTLITNIPGETLPARFTVVLGGRCIEGRKGASFESVPPLSLIAFVGSAGLLELAIRDGSAAAALEASVGDQVVVQAAA